MGQRYCLVSSSGSFLTDYEYCRPLWKKATQAYILHAFVQTFLAVKLKMLEVILLTSKEKAV